MVAFTRFAVALTVVSEKEMMVCQLKGTVASLRATGFAHDVVCMTHVDSGMARTHAATLERTCTHVLQLQARARSTGTTVWLRVVSFNVAIQETTHAI